MASILNVDKIRRAAGTTDAISIDSSDNAKIAGHVVAVHQFTASEQTITSATNVINSTFTPKFDDSKYFVTFTIPNLTMTEGNYFQADVYIGTDTTYSNNTKVFTPVLLVRVQGLVTLKHFVLRIMGHIRRQVHRRIPSPCGVLLKVSLPSLVIARL